MSVKWSDLIKNPDYEEAYTRIAAFCRMVVQERCELSYYDVAQVMLAGAFAVADYIDIGDVKRDIEERPEYRKKVRLGNFLDYVAEYAEKRLALIEETDSYLLQKARILDRSEDVALNDDMVDFDDLVDEVDALSYDILGSALERLPVAKAYVDAAFVCASEQGAKSYAEFCEYVIKVMDNASEDDEDADIFAQKEAEFAEHAKKATVLGASGSIH